MQEKIKQGGYPIQREFPLDGCLNADKDRLVPPFLAKELHTNRMAIRLRFLLSDLDGEDRLRIGNMPTEDRVHGRRI